MLPDLSLAAEAQQELDRRRAARMTRDELATLADDLIVAWHQQCSVIQQATREIAGLQCQLALADCPQPGTTEPAPRHFQWARELLGLRSEGE